ncbi:MAG: glycosyltransferase family 1 protein [Pirellulales bacterium]
MRVVIVAEVFIPKIDGVVVRTMNLIEHLLAGGDELLVVCPHAEGRDNCPVSTLEFRSFPFPAYPEYRIGIPDKRLPEVIRRFDPDVLHYINPFAFGFRCYDLLQQNGVTTPSVFSFHTLYGEFVKRYPLMKPLSRMLWWLMRDYHNCADRNLTVSTIMQETLIERGFERVEFWPPAVDSTLFTPQRSSAVMRERLSGGHPDSPLLLTVSRLAPEKSVKFLRGVIEQVPQARLAIVGDGPQRGELEAAFAGTNTRFVGYLSGAELATAYASADAFVYASETETMGNVVLEAMASGLPVVAPRAGGIPSLMTHGETGMLFPPGDTQAAVDAVEVLLTDADFRSHIGAAARQRVVEWGWRNSAERVRQHYSDTVAERALGGGAAARRRRLAPAVVAALVLAFRAMALGSRGPSGAATNRAVPRTPLTPQLSRHTARP